MDAVITAIWAVETMRDIQLVGMMRRIVPSQNAALAL